MTRRERVIEAVRHKETDFVPYNITFTPPARDKMARLLGDRDFEAKIGNHIAAARYDGFPRELEPGSGFWEDDFGVVWNRNGTDRDAGVLQNLVLARPDMDDYKFPKPDVPRMRGEYERLLESCQDRFRLCAVGYALFERAWTLRGMANLLQDMLLEPAFVDSLLEAVAGHNLKVIDAALEYDIDGILFHDDWGQQTGLIMGARLWRRYIKPHVAGMYERVKRKGKLVFQHSLGDTRDILPDLIEMGLDVYGPLQPDICNPERTKREFGRSLAFWGGISAHKLLPFASSDEVRRVARETLRLMGKGGGYIAAPTRDVPRDVPVENVEALIEAFQNQGNRQ